MNREVCLYLVQDHRAGRSQGGAVKSGLWNHEPTFLIKIFPPHLTISHIKNLIHNPVQIKLLSESVLLWQFRSSEKQMGLDV